MDKSMKRKIPILLTATVNPNGMQGASFSVEERISMYAEALRFYINQKLDVIGCIVFAENSGSVSLVRSRIDDPSIEWIDASGNEYDQTKGKGYNETILIRKTIQLSDSIQQAGCFFKITGRLKILNIGNMLDEVARRGMEGLQFLADCKDHNLYTALHMPINGHAGECRYWFATIDFFESVMLKYLPRLNDYQPLYLAEDAMLAVCRETRGTKGCYDRFRTQARISGKGGHDLGKGLSFFYSTDNDSVTLRFKCGLRQMLRWCLPSIRL